MLNAALQLRRLIQALLSFRSDSNETIVQQLERHAQRQGGRLFLRFGERRYSYAEANAEINRHAHAYASLGIGPGDVVALLMENRPEFLFHVYGLHKLGAVASLINTNLSGDALLHAIRICEPKQVVSGSELWHELRAIRPALSELGQDAALVDVDVEAPVPAETGSFSELLAGASTDNPESSGKQLLGDVACYIYTSGTTGLPKAAVVKHERLFRAGAAWSSIGLVYRPGDVMYNCLPLYHANGLLLATGSAITAGVTLALARRFSRTRFWDDVRNHGATSFIYIGELCRYLMNIEPSPRDREHSVRVVTGNGLRPDIWQDFQRRFGIARVAEFYAATEGNCITVNFANVVGSVGPMMPGMALAAWDEAQQQFVRDARGRLLKAKVGEPGILIGKIRASAPFDGYRDQRETERKVLRDVFRDGDAYFNTGDLLKVDWRRHLYFTDRVGDTFRWKGENVSTTEVQEQISKWPPAAEVNVYGVQVPGTEGRAGMAALALLGQQSFDPEAFKVHVDGALPAYARPLFVRLQSAIATTGTFKMKKNDLQSEGFDPARIDDPIYMRHPERDEYVRLDRELYEDVARGKLRI